MRNILIGSRALNYWHPEMKIKDTADWDIIAHSPIQSTPSYKIEQHDPWLLNNEEFAKFTDETHTVEINGHKIYVCNPIGLSIIKRSHLWRDIKFDKHITHYHKFLKPYVEFYTSSDNDLLRERTAMTMKAYPQGNPNLMQSKEDFFDDAVEKKYDHDYLHELFAYYDKPLYTRLLRQTGMAWCDESKWNNLTHEDKLKCISEEVQVIATERFLLPNDWKYISKLAYNKALSKVCTTLCSGWFRSNAIDYYPELLSLYDADKFLEVKRVLSVSF